MTANANRPKVSSGFRIASLIAMFAAVSSWGSLTAFAQSASMSKAQALGVESDSGIPSPSYAFIEKEIDSLVSQYPNLVKRIIYGSTIDGRNLNLVRIAKQNATAKLPRPKAIFIGGSVHGDEYLAIEDRLPRWFAERAGQSTAMAKFFEQGGVVYIVPVLNPDGFARRERLNTHAKDLNRDFTVRAVPVGGFSELETLQLYDYIDNDIRSSRLNLSVMLDYHCCIGALLYPWSFKPSPSLPEGDLSKLLKIGGWFTDIFGSRYRVGTTPSVLGYSATGTSKDFFYERYGAASFAFQGLYKTENRNFALHALFWDRIIQGLVAGEI